MRRVIVAVVLSLGCAGQLPGQECLGTPLTARQVEVGAGVGLGEGFTNLGASTSAHLVGPIYGGVGYSRSDYDNVENSGNTVSSAIAVEVRVVGLSICPHASVAYGRMTIVRDGFLNTSTYAQQSVRGSFVSVPVGIGIGRRFAVGSAAYLIVSAGARGGPVRNREEIHELQYTAAGRFLGEAEWEDSTTETEADGGLSLTLGAGPFFGSGGVSVSSATPDQALVSLGVGLLIRVGGGQ